MRLGLGSWSRHAPRGLLRLPRRVGTAALADLVQRTVAQQQVANVSGAAVQAEALRATLEAVVWAHRDHGGLLNIRMRIEPAARRRSRRRMPITKISKFSLLLRRQRAAPQAKPSERSRSKAKC